MSEKKSVTVTIFKNEYTLKGDAEPQRIIDLAHYVDTRMTEMGQKSSAAPDKIAILVAMNIADELHRLEKINEDNIELIEHLEKNFEEIKTTADMTMKNAAAQNEETDRVRIQLSEEKQKLQALTQQKNHAEQMMEDFKKEVETLLVENSRIKSGFDGSQNAALELQTILEEKKRTCEIAEAEVRNLKSQCDALNLKLTDMREALEKAERFPTPAQLTEKDFIVSDEKLRGLIKKIEAVLE
jgi:cell division protein ZapA